MTLFLVAMFGIHFSGMAQRNWRPPHKQSWTWNNFRHGYQAIGGSINAMNYFGDLTPLQGFYSTDVRFTRANFSVFYMKRHTAVFSSRIMFSVGRISGYDTVSTDPKHIHNQFRYIRNLHFRNDIYELSYNAIFDLKPHREVFYRRPEGIIPYLVVGIGVFYHNPQALSPKEFGEQWVNLRPMGTEGQGKEGFGTTYSKFQIAFPLGFGFRKRLGQRWDIAFEVVGRVLLTDYLDDVSGKYTDLGVFGDDELAKAMHDRSKENTRRLETSYIPPDYTYIGKDGRSYTTFIGFGNDQYPDNIRGNSRDRDFYTITGIHLTYILPGQVRCPETFRVRRGKYSSFFGQKGGMR